jgi:Tfp pilus assembly protein PilF
MPLEARRRQPRGGRLRKMPERQLAKTMKTLVPWRRDLGRPVGDYIKRLHACALLFGITLFCAVALQAESAPPAFEVTHYNIEADLFPSTHMLKALARVDFTPQADLTVLNFELHSALRVQSVKDASGQDLQFKQAGPSLEVDFLNPVRKGTAASITVSYGGSLATDEGSPVEGLNLAHVGPEGSFLLYSGRWFPVETGGLDRFSATMKISVPPGQIVIASGKASMPEHETGKTIYTFDYAQRSFPGTVIAGEYSVQPAADSGADVALYMMKGHEHYASSYGEAAGKILSFYTAKFGALPDPHLSLVEIPDGTVASYSAPGITALASRGFSNQVNYPLLGHELSHQWWRVLVSPATADDAFLDEGLATYSSAMVTADLAGEAAFEDRMHEIAIDALTHEEVAPISQASQLHPFTPEYDSIVYKKGAMVFHMLRWVIGDDAFFKSLQDMVKQYAWKSITTDEFQQLTEQASKQQLTYFYALWVNSTGVPQFKRTWAIYRTAKGYQVVGKVQQDLDIFRMPVEIRVYTESRKPITSRVEMVGTTTDFTVDTVTEPKRVVVDPASRLLKFDDQMKVDVMIARADQLVQQQAYLEAIKEYQKVLDIDKSSSLAHYRIGENLFRMHNYSAAAEEMRQALNGNLEPKWVEVWAHLTLGKIFDATGQRDRALHEYQRALQTNDNTQGALDEANRYIQKPFNEKAKQLS